MGKLGVVSLGCAKNLVDTEIMLGQLVAKGWELTEDFAQAELILINTCGFIKSAKEESLQQIFEYAKYKNPGVGLCKTLIVAGCLVQRYPTELAAEIPEVDHWIGLADIGEISQIIRPGSQGRSMTAEPFLNDQNLPRYQVTLKHTAYVKIAEGCNHRCSYCAIPLIKGRFRSRNPVSIVREIQELVQHGVKEINLIAQDITQYGADLTPRTNLAMLLTEIIHQAKPEWIRLLYAYPQGIDQDLLKLMATQPSICKYLDLPLQHINSRILKLMNRPESPDFIKEKLIQIRTALPEIALRTTFLVGFPSETEAEFDELLSFVNAGFFDHAGVFAYSREEGTRAFEMKAQIKEKVAEDRRRIILEAQQKVSAQYLAKQVQREATILIDEARPGQTAIGRTAQFAPDVDGVVYLQHYRGEAGKFIKGRILGSDQYNLHAEEIF